MNSSAVVNFYVGLVCLILLQGAMSVEGRNILNTGNHFLNPKEETDVQNKILSLLLQKSLVPVERSDPLGMELANKLADLEELQALREDLELEREITANLAQSKSVTRKRGEPCFWKYCV